MTIITKKMRHDIKGELPGSGLIGRWEEEKRGCPEVKWFEVYYMYMYEDSFMKPTKHS
jgi:hypothetical protein